VILEKRKAWRNGFGVKLLENRVWTSDFGEAIEIPGKV
jgi:hypothetical protein